MISAVLLASMLQQPLPLVRSNTPAADTGIFHRLELPAPNAIRTGSGAPGPLYWQQRVDYTITVSLDTAAHRATGHQTVTYHNNSPDTLRYLWFQVDQNLFKDASRGSFLEAPGARFASNGFVGGMDVTNVAALRGGAAARGRAAAAERAVPLSPVVNGTMMRIDLDQPLPPRGVVRLAMDFAFNVPEHGADRMGRQLFDGHWLYEMAQWQPRAVVYDDVRGWNTEQYLGQGEFYLEYGDWDYAITVPRDYVVMGTGTLENKAEVLTPEEVRRLDAALHSDTTMPIVSKAEAGTPAMRPSGDSPTLTWHFQAHNVRDVAWAAAPNFIWDASGWNNILMQSFYPAASTASDSGWQLSTKMVRFTIQHYSEKWFQYPWPTAINIAGPAAGMEYPMIVFCGWQATSRDLYGVTTHELGHGWFPMIVGSNERLYPWMDEGFNTFINIFSEAAFYSQPPARGPQGQAAQLGNFMRSGFDMPIMTAADRTDDRLLGVAAYFKPGGGLYILRHAMLEDSTRFDSAFREYVRRWAFHHPTPADFFRTMEDNLGEDLSYFWRGWFFRTDRVDQAIDSVTSRDTLGVTTTKVFLASPGSLPMPVDLRVTYQDGTRENIRLPIEIWFHGMRYIWVHRFPKAVARFEIDPDMNFPDVDRANNAWPRTGTPAPTTP
ncbi:MAG: M1 family metallopeptidase [Gemmatimonadales bacterium]